MDRLKLEFPTMVREKDALEFIEEFYDNNSEINGTGGLQRYMDDYVGWIEKINKDLNKEPDEERVPAETYFLVRESDDRIVGMINIRLALNYKLWNNGGHIGYSIRPSERRKGYNNINLYLALIVCANRGLEAVLLDCDKENLGSSKTIQALGGKMIYEYFDSEKNITIQNYVIDIEKSLAENRERFSEMIAEYPG